eukprot:jgi/Undpi1/12036/HiC_scaffold_4.g01735.m1
MSAPAGGVSSWFVDLIMKPGTSVQLVPVINVTLVLIVGLLAYLAVNGEQSIHVYIMGFLSVGLMASVNWFISEFRKVKRQQEQDGGGDAAGTGDAAGRQKSD